MFDSIPSSAPHIKSGRLRGIGVASSKRSPALPDMPALGEQLAGFEADSLFGLMAPAGTPREVIARINAEVQKVIATADVRERLTAQGGNPFMDFQLPQAILQLKQGAGRLIRDETDRGVLMLCDPRLHTRAYGRRVRESLPPMKQTRVLADVEAFLAKMTT